MKKNVLLLAALYFSINVCHAQNVGINTGNGGSTTPNASAVLDLNSNNSFASPNGKGLLIPNVALTSSTDAVTIASPAPSLLVYNTGTGGLSPAGYYYNSNTAASPLWLSLNKTHIVISEAMSPPQDMTGGDGHTFGYGGFELSAWTPGNGVAENIITNPGEGAYFAPVSETIYNIKVNGWVLNHDPLGNSTNASVYLMHYRLGTAALATNTNTLTPVEASPYYVGAWTAYGTHGVAPFITPTGVVPFSISVTSLSLNQGDVLILVIQSNNTGSYTFYTQAQLEFDIFD